MFQNAVKFGKKESDRMVETKSDGAKRSESRTNRSSKASDGDKKVATSVVQSCSSISLPL